MKDYPQLASMGILHPGQIDEFSVNSIMNFDVLNIIYRRSKGSLLPSRRTYRFLRVQKTATINNKSGEEQSVLESAPALRSALDELRDLLEKKEHKLTTAESILEQVKSLEEDVAMRIEWIRELVGRI